MMNRRSIEDALVFHGRITGKWIIQIEPKRVTKDLHRLGYEMAARRKAVAAVCGWQGL